MLSTIGLMTCAFWSIVSFAIAYMHFRMICVFEGQGSRIYIGSGALLFGAITGYIALAGLLHL